MKSLLELSNLESDISGRLFHPTDSGRSELISFFKGVLHDGRELIKEAHFQGCGGLELSRLRSSFIDTVLKSIWSFGCSSSDKKDSGINCSLLAIGGFGRGELSPNSDIDLLFVAPAINSEIHEFTQKVLYLLWDLGLDLGHSVRKISDCIEISKKDYVSQTSMLESRLISGSPTVYSNFLKKMQIFLKKGYKANHLVQRIKERNERYRNWDPSVYVQEPNIKESAGGLRDYHEVVWLVKSFGYNNLEDISKNRPKGIESLVDARDSYDFLLRIRSQLHFQSNSKNDVLSFSSQMEAAKSLGYVDSEATFAGEYLMQDYYRSARNLNSFCKEIFEVLDSEAKQRRFFAKKVTRDTIEYGLIWVGRKSFSAGDFSENLKGNPNNLMFIFEIMYKYSSNFNSDIRDLIRSSIHLVDDNFRSSLEVRESFFRILNGKTGVARVLHEMHELGFLSAYIPEFESLNCFVQYDHYHRYTADEHTLLTLNVLDDLAYTKDVNLNVLAHVYRELDRTYLLRFALLLHDIGKGKGDRHVHKSASLLPEIILRMGLPSDEGRVLQFLVLHHVEMSMTSQRRDLQDSSLISQFAEKMETKEQLQMLYLLSYADISSVAPGIWNDWHGTLLFDLYKKTLDVMESGQESYEEKHEMAVLEQVKSRAGVRYVDLKEDEIEKHLQLMPKRYLDQTNVETILTHIELRNRMIQRKELFSIEVIHKRSENISVLTIVCFDRIGLFGLISSVLTKHAINVLDARIYTRDDGLVVDTFQVVSADGGVVEDNEKWALFKEDFYDVLNGGIKLPNLMSQNKKHLKLKKQLHFYIPTIVEFDLGSSELATVLEVITPDRHGLLAMISNILTESGLSILSAKVSTQGPRAVDSFYLTDLNGLKVNDKSLLNSLSEELFYMLDLKSSEEDSVFFS